MPAPIFDLFAAPGTGKTTLVPHLVELAPPGLVVIDLDELLEDGSLLGVPIAHPDAAEYWPAYNRMWDKITTIVRRSDTAVLILTPVPEVEEITGHRGWVPPVHWCLLDGDDDVRRGRLAARGWDADRVAYEAADAAAGRRLGVLDQVEVIMVGPDEAPAATAERVLAWVASLR